jgi:hypothetical protein
MAGNTITKEQILKMIGTMNIDFGGFKNDKGTKVISGYVSYTQPIINKKLDLTIGAAGHYATGDWGTDKGIDYKGISLNYKF